MNHMRKYRIHFAESGWETVELPDTANTGPDRKESFLEWLECHFNVKVYDWYRLR